jgi:hypothetical protein
VEELGAKLLVLFEYYSLNLQANFGPIYRQSPRSSAILYNGLSLHAGGLESKKIDF